MSKTWKTITVFATVGFFVMPVFRSGMREGLTGFEFILNHTILSDNTIEYIPEEDYLRLFEQKKLQ